MVDLTSCRASDSYGGHNCCVLIQYILLNHVVVFLISQELLSQIRVLKALNLASSLLVRTVLFGSFLPCLYVSSIMCTISRNKSLSILNLFNLSYES